MASAAKLQKKDVKYLGRDFSAFRENLIEFAKTYFPNTYNDFNESDPGMMFIEMASYVGDVLSYYVDDRFKESLLSYAEELDNVFEIAQSLGYRPKLATPSSTIVDVFQTVPATGTGDDVKPDMRYAVSVGAGMQIASRNGITFRSEEDVTSTHYFCRVKNNENLKCINTFLESGRFDRPVFVKPRETRFGTR